MRLTSNPLGLEDRCRRPSSGLGSGVRSDNATFGEIAAVDGRAREPVSFLVSRFRPQPFNERHGLLVSASPSMVGGNRGLWALRIPFEHLGARLYLDMFSLAQAHT